MAQTKEIISTVNDLIETLKDGQEGFRQAAEAVNDSQLKTLFSEYSLQRSRFAGELQNEVINLGESNIVLLTVTLACLGAFIGLYFTGETVNIMTLGGLALVVCLLIDQSIVVLENATRHASLGKPVAHESRPPLR